jgi:flagellar biosynthesis/type III secretory pathway protein FliH
MEDAAVHTAAKRALHSVLDEQRAEELMGSWAEEMIERGVQKGLAMGREEGLARGRAEDVLRILTVRGVHVDEASRQRILTCTHVATLDRWFDRSLNAATLSDVLDDLAQ